MTSQMVIKENTTSAMDSFNPRNLVRAESLLPPCRFQGLGECLPSMFKAQGLILSNQGPELEQKDPKFSYPQLHSELKANLGYKKFCLGEERRGERDERDKEGTSAGLEKPLLI